MFKKVFRAFLSLTVKFDHGGRYDNKAFAELRFAERLEREMTVPYFPH